MVLCSLCSHLHAITCNCVYGVSCFRINTRTPVTSSTSSYYRLLVYSTILPEFLCSTHRVYVIISNLQIFKVRITRCIYHVHTCVIKERTYKIFSTLDTITDVKC